MSHPILESKRSIDNLRGRGHSPIESRRIDNGFEGGTRLPSRLSGTVEFAFAEVPAADHGPDGPCAGVHAKEGALNHIP